jgi:hypothetical protein
MQAILFKQALHFIYDNYLTRRLDGKTAKMSA